VKNLLTVFGSYLNEPGAHRRSSTVDLGLAFTSRANRVFLDLEYVKAVQREVYPDAPRAYNDGVFAATAGYATTLARPGIHRGGMFRGRRSRVHDYPFVTAVRYETYDDGLTVARNIRSTRDRVSSVGCRSPGRPGSAVGTEVEGYPWATAYSASQGNGSKDAGVHVLKGLYFIEFRRAESWRITGLSSWQTIHPGVQSSRGRSPP
jgi:hypothetical protein